MFTPVPAEKTVWTPTIADFDDRSLVRILYNGPLFYTWVSSLTPLDKHPKQTGNFFLHCEYFSAINAASMTL
jgi:hypothetical protein